MSRIYERKNFTGVRVLPPLPAPSQNGAYLISSIEDFPPPPPPLTEELTSVKIVEPPPTEVLKSKSPNTKVLPTTGKWKVPKSTSVMATQEQLLAQGLRLSSRNENERPGSSMSGDELDVGREDPSREQGEFFRRSPSPRSGNMLENPELPENVGLLVMEACQTASWTSLENLLRLLEKANRYPEKQEQVSTAIAFAEEETLMTPLMVCAKESRPVPAEMLVLLGADINAKNKEGETALHIAAREAKEEMVRLIIQLGADASVQGGILEQLPIHISVMRKFGAWPITQFLLPLSGPEGKMTADKEGFIPLWRATENGNLHVIHGLLSEDAHQQLCYQNQEQNADTLAHYMIRKKNTEIFRILLENEAPLDNQNVDGETLLHLATRLGHIDAVNLLYEKRADPNILDNEGRSALSLAVEKGLTNVVDTLVERFRGSLKTRTKDGSTLAHIAALAGHAATVELLIKRGVPVSMPNKEGNIALHVAAKNGHADVVQVLLKNGSKVDAPTKQGFTSLHLAVEAGYPNVVEVLIGRGAAVNAKGGPLEETPLHLAPKSPKGELSAEYLLKSGARPVSRMTDGTTPLHVAVTAGSLKLVKILMAEGASVNDTNHGGETPLHIATLCCNYDVVRELLDFISRTESRDAAAQAVNVADDVGETAMHHVAQVTLDKEHFPGEDQMLTQLLLDFHGDPNAPTIESLETPLHYCARYGNFEILSTIIGYFGAEKLATGINKQDKNGWSPLLTASEQGNADIVRVLLKNHARVDVFDEEGRAALHLAAENDHLEVVDILLQHKAFVNAKNKDGVTAAHVAAERGASDIVELLVDKYQAATDVVSMSKKTPLHLAAQAGQFSICERLLRLGADGLAKDGGGRTPAHLASAGNHAKVVKLFLQTLKDTDYFDIYDTKGLNIVHTAAKNGCVDVIQVLLAHNRELVVSSKVKSTESSVLHIAAATGHDFMVKMLIAEGAPVAEENKEGLTPLHLAARYGHVKILDALRDAVSLNVCSVKTGLTPLHLAAFCGQSDFVRELLVDVPATTLSEQPTANNPLVKHLQIEPGMTALHCASHSGQENTVRLLLNVTGVMADAATTMTETTPLHLAARNGKLPVASLLLSKIGPRIDVRDKKGRSALMLAAGNGHLEMVTLLVGQGSDITAVDSNEWAPLHFAAISGHLKVVKYLVESGAATSVKNKDGKIPMGLAAGATKAQVVLFLVTKTYDAYSLMEDRTFLFDLMMCGRKEQNRPLQEFIINSPSPVEIGLKISRFYTDLSAREKEQERDLNLAAKFVESLASDLLTIACNKFNPAVILRAVDTTDKSLMNILIEGEHKEVVALPAVQRYLTAVWHGNQHWSDKHSFVTFLGFLFFPPFWFFASLPLGHKYNYIPFVKLMSHIVSHLFFILLLLLVTMAPFEKLYEWRTAAPSPVEVILIVWIVGKIVGEFTTKEERSGLGIIRVVIIVLCVIALILHGIAFAFADSDYYKTIEVLYTRNQVFALASLFACIQIISYLSFHYMFGPFAIIIRDVIKDLLRFLVILILFMVGFTFMLSSLYKDVYRPPPDFEYEGAHVMNMAVDPLASFILLYFALFGTVNPPDLPDAKYGPSFASTLVVILFAIYLLTTMVVLINLLIAMLSDTYQRIQARSDLEWKYGRSKLVMNMDIAPVTPPPMNIVTVAFSTLQNIYHKILNRKKKFVDLEGDTVSNASSHKSGKLQWRNSVEISDDTSLLFRYIPVRKLPNCIDWKVVVAGYATTAMEDDEDLLALEIENEMV